MEWLNEIKSEVPEMLDGDTRLIYELCGLEVLIKLWEHCPRINLYVSTKPLKTAMKLYIQKNYDGTNAKQIALRLRCSESFVYQQANHGGDNTAELF